MCRSLKLYFAVLLFLLVCIGLIICSQPSIEMDDTYERLDLGFNNDNVDSCDYLDYGELTRDRSVMNNLAILQLNIRGLLNKQDKLKNLLNDIKNDSRVDVAMLVETWLNKNNGKRVKIPGYQFYGFHRKQKKGGGVGILISQEFQSRIRKDLCLNVPDFESITLEIRTNNDSLFVCTIYRPPNSKEKEFIKHYRRLLGKFRDTQLEKLIRGLDNNLDFKHHTRHPPTKEFIDINLDNNLIPTITKPQRITRTSSNLIDNIIVGKQFHDYEANIEISDISHHLPLILKSYQPELYKKQPLTITTRAINEQKCEAINTKLQNIDWDIELNSKSANEAYTSFHTKMQEILNTETPIKAIKVKPSKVLKEVWMSPGLLRSIKKQKQLYKKPSIKIQV